MNNRFGDNSFSQLLHTPLSQLDGLQRRQQDISASDIAFVVYNLARYNMQPTETLTIDGRIDEEARTIFNTYTTMLQQVFSPHMQHTGIPMLQMAKCDYDFSLLVSPLARILELELNNSIIQMVRHEKGIEMPTFYRKVKPGMECVININQKVINLNKKRDGGLTAQTIGETCILIEMFRDRLSERLGFGKDNSKIKELCKKIETLRKYRNTSSHITVMGESDFLQFYKEYCSFIREGWFCILMDCKEKMKG